MTMYRYVAKTLSGEETAGVIHAASADEALDALLDRGFSDVQVTRMHADRQHTDREHADREHADREYEDLEYDDQTPGAPGDPVVVATSVEQSPFALSGKEANQLAQQVAQVSMAKVPLAAGLRAAAEETDNRRVSRALRWIADQVDQGRSLEDTLTHSGRFLPAHVSGLILAAARTGTLGEALMDLVEQQQSVRSLRREILSGLVYPLVVVGLAVVVLLYVIYFVMGPIGQMFDEFGLKLPAATQLVFWWRDTGWWILALALLGFLALLVLVRLLAGRARWQRLTSTMPLFGGLWQATAIAEWAGLLNVLLKHRMPLPEALRLAGHGMRNAHIGQISLRLADGVARGRSLSQMMFSYRSLPSSLIPLLEWGEKTGTLSESFGVGREMFAKRAGTRAALVQFLIPPILFIWIGSTVLFVVAATFLPLVDLVSKLS
ncbi:MAG: type II secretion system F family protein [Pirellulaceae bacterium]